MRKNSKGVMASKRNNCSLRETSNMMRKSSKRKPKINWIHQDKKMDHSINIGLTEALTINTSCHGIHLLNT